MTRIMFPRNYDEKGVDPFFETERKAARAVGFEISYMDHANTHSKSVGRLDHPERTIYRGWMMTPGQYREFHDGCVGGGYALVTPPMWYRAAHHLPGWYPMIAGHTFPSVYSKNGHELGQLMHEAKWALGCGPAIVKDFVKSMSHNEDAFFVPDVMDATKFRSVLERFIELSDGQPQGGLVVRKFAELDPCEFRVWVAGVDDKRRWRLTPHVGHPDPCDYPPTEVVEKFLRRLPLFASPFFSMDIARIHSNGEWRIVEIGDGGVSGVREGWEDPLYGFLREAFRNG